MVLDIQEDIPPHDKEIYIVVVRKAFIHESKGECVLWTPINEDLPIGYLLPDSPVLRFLPK